MLEIPKILFLYFFISIKTLYTKFLLAIAYKFLSQSRPFQCRPKHLLQSESNAKPLRRKWFLFSCK